MFRLLSLCLVPFVAAASGDELVPTKTEYSQPTEYYVVVMEKECDSIKNPITYEGKCDKINENSGIATLEEYGRTFDIEKKPFAHGEVRSVSGEENTVGLKEIIADLDAEFEYMFRLKDMIELNEKENAKLWSEYYAIKDLYDRALSKYTENWAEDNGIAFVPKKAWRR